MWLHPCSLYMKTYIFPFFSKLPFIGKLELNSEYWHNYIHNVYETLILSIKKKTRYVSNYEL